MKKLVLILGLCFFCTMQVQAEEINKEQSISNDQTYLTGNFQKQPQDSKPRQGISNHFTFFTVNVQINGKIKDISENNAN